METVKIRNNEEFVRDINTNAVLNTDNNALDKYKKAMNRDRESQQEIVLLQRQLVAMDSRISKLEENKCL